MCRLEAVSRLEFGSRGGDAALRAEKVAIVLVSQKRPVEDSTACDDAQAGSNLHYDEIKGQFEGSDPPPPRIRRDRRGVDAPLAA